MLELELEQEQELLELQLVTEYEYVIVLTLDVPFIKEVSDVFISLTSAALATSPDHCVRIGTELLELE